MQSIPETEAPATRPAERSVATRPWVSWTILASLLVFTVAKGLLWVFVIAPLDAPDEPSHFNYVIQVREGYRLPVVDLVSPGGLRTPPSTPLNADVRAWFARYDYKFFRSMPYESAQPPLYYWAAAIAMKPIGISPGTLPALLTLARLASLVFGVGSVLALWLACTWAWPGSLWPRLAACLALTLSPEFSFTTAAVSNDAGIISWGAVMLALWALGLRLTEGKELASRRIAPLVVAAGLVTAAGVLTKLTFIATIPVTALWIFWLVGGRLRAWLSGLIGFGLPALVLVGPWVLRNLRVYGEPTGARAIFDLIHGIYWQRAGLPPQQLFSEFPPIEFVGRSFRSFWALFGWATVWLDAWVYWLLALFVVTGMVGALASRLTPHGERLPRTGSRLAVLSGGLLLLAFANYVGYNSLVEFQPHMRYTFVSLPAALLLLTLALGSVEWRGMRALPAIFLAVLGAVHIWSLVVLSAHTQYVLDSVVK